MTALLTGLASLLVFGSVILVHELGHFMAARHCGIHVEEFSIGFGPRLWSTTRDGTTYSVRLLPLGGYNLFSPLPDEEDDEEDESGESAPPPAPKPRKTTLFPLAVSGQKFEDATAWQRFFVTLCGALMNFILGVAVLLVLVLTGQGRQHDDCGLQRERHKLRSPAGGRYDFADLQQPLLDGLRHNRFVLHR